MCSNENIWKYIPKTTRNVVTSVIPAVFSYKVTSYERHPEYDKSHTTDFDVAIVTLAKPVLFNGALAPICLASSKFDESKRWVRRIRIYQNTCRNKIRRNQYQQIVYSPTSLTLTLTAYFFRVRCLAGLWAGQPTNLCADLPTA